MEKYRKFDDPSWNPDNIEVCQAKFNQINEAYEVLSNRESLSPYSHLSNDL